MKVDHLQYKQMLLFLDGKVETRITVQKVKVKKDMFLKSVSSPIACKHCEQHKFGKSKKCVNLNDAAYLTGRNGLSSVKLMEARW